MRSGERGGCTSKIDCVLTLIRFFFLFPRGELTPEVCPSIWLHSMFIYTKSEAWTAFPGAQTELLVYCFVHTTGYCLLPVCCSEYTTLNTTPYDVSVFDISRNAYFTITPNSTLKIPKRRVLVSRGCEIAHRGKHDRLNAG